MIRFIKFISPFAIGLFLSWINFPTWIIAALLFGYIIIGVPVMALYSLWTIPEDVKKEVEIAKAIAPKKVWDVNSPEYLARFMPKA